MPERRHLDGPMNPVERSQATDWASAGTTRFHAAVIELDDVELDQPSLLPGWTRRHVAVHVAANADALLNLTRWAATGVPTPMYRSSSERDDVIAGAPSVSRSQLHDWLSSSATALDAAWRNLAPEQWRTVVTTAQGRRLPALAIPWLRTREVWIHGVDLDRNLHFSDFPHELLCALRDDIVTRRGAIVLPESPLDGLVAWLSGRPYDLPGTPALGPWL